MAATKAGEIDKVLSVMAVGAIFLVPGRPVMHKSDFAAAARAMAGPDALQFAGSSKILEIKIISDWAFMWSGLKVVVTPSVSGSPAKRAGHTLTILNKQNGNGWRALPRCLFPSKIRVR